MRRVYWRTLAALAPTVAAVSASNVFHRGAAQAHGQRGEEALSRHREVAPA
jgi:hypothetical protein